MRSFIFKRYDIVNPIKFRTKSPLFIVPFFVLFFGFFEFLRNITIINSVCNNDTIQKVYGIYPFACAEFSELPAWD